MRHSLKTMAALALGAACTGAAAEGLDGTTPILCAASTVVVCARPGECVVGPPEAVNLPVFWHIDPAGKTIQSKRESGETRKSGITTVSASGGKLVLQGSDEGLGWSVSVEQANGRMVLTAGREDGYVVFGACTAL